MEKPGIERAIPGAIIGIAIGAGFVPFIRWASNIEPYWDFELAVVVVAFTMIGGWLWGIGAFNPKNSQHAHPPHHGDDEHDEHGETALAHADHHDEEEEAPTPLALLMRETWKALTYPLLLFAIFLGFAAVPGGFFLQTASEADANVLAFGDGTVFTLPIIGEFAVNQLTMFILLLLAVIIPLAATAGGIGFLLFKGHEEAAIAAETEPTVQDLTPPPPVRWAGRIAKNIANGLREGLPKFFGMR